MKKKTVPIILAVCLLLMGSGCRESSPQGANKQGGAVTVSRQENQGNSESKDGQKGKALSYRMNVYKDRELLPVYYEYRVDNLQFFEHYTDANIPKEEFVEQYANDNEFILMDITIKKISGPTKDEAGYNDNIEYLNLANEKMRKEPEKASSPIPCYFSGHSDKNYYQYWLEPGEEKTYQVGWCLCEPMDEQGALINLTDTEGLALYIGLNAGLQGDYIELSEWEGK